MRLSRHVDGKFPRWGQFVPMFALFSMFSIGCGGGDSGPPRFDISGTVTYNGQPVPVGSIQFLPDASKGNSGPAGYATITDGKFNTSSGGKGVASEGTYQVTITGFSQVQQTTPDPDAEVPDYSLFPEYRATVDLSKSSSTQDFVVPVKDAN